MRNKFNAAMMALCDSPNFCFLTGDLGFMALEPLKDLLGARFFNMGISEQNMISVAAGMAHNGLRPWVYSIAPFCYARPFEQIRNDICFHNLPVRLVGNGAGYGYGVQGPSHHAIEDCGVMSSLQNMQVFSPAFNSDIAYIVEILEKNSSPAYIRLGADEAPADAARPSYAPMRKLCKGQNGIVIAFGAIAGSVWESIHTMSERDRPSLWCCCQLPLLPEYLPSELIGQLTTSTYTLVIEEHVATGGFGAALARLLLLNEIDVKKFTHLHAAGYPSGLYGSQKFHRSENGIGKDEILNTIQKLGSK
jgi:transketolase